jgi:hypothetical protein
MPFINLNWLLLLDPFLPLDQLDSVLYASYPRHSGPRHKRIFIVFVSVFGGGEGGRGGEDHDGIRSIFLPQHIRLPIGDIKMRVVGWEGRRGYSKAG